MRAAALFGAGDVRVVDVPDPRLIEPTDALIAVNRAAICGSDLWPYKTMERSDSGRPMGHEAIGVVDSVGDDVHTIKVGDLVVMPFACSDGTCVFCSQGLQTSCIHGASSAPRTSVERRPRQCASRRPTARSSSCRPATTRR